MKEVDSRDQNVQEYVLIFSRKRTASGAGTVGKSLAGPGQAPGKGLAGRAPPQTPRKHILKERIIGLALALAVLTACGGPRTTIEYEAVEVGHGDIQPAAITTGVFYPTVTAEVGSQVSGRIATIYAHTNDKVTKDEVLAELDQEQFQAKIKQINDQINNITIARDVAQKNLRVCENRYSRSKALFERKLISDEEIDNSELQYQQARAQSLLREGELKQAKSQLALAEIDLSYTVIKSPIDGIVIQQKVQEGQVITAGFQTPVLFEIAADLSVMEIKANIKEADVGKIREGQRVIFTCPAFPGQVFYGTVVQVQYNPQVVEGKVAFPAIIRVNNPGSKFRPQMTAFVSVAEAKGVLRVPNAALTFKPSELADSEEEDPEPSGHVIWVKDGTGIRAVKVETGERDDDYTEIRSGLKKGDFVIVKEKTKVHKNGRKPKPKPASIKIQKSK
jgi:HlyD family secretion protein